MIEKKSKNPYLSAINHLSKHDNVMSRIIKKFGKCNLAPHTKYFTALLKAIVGQQLSIASAAAINKRFIANYENKITPQMILKTRDEELKSFGLSVAKIKYVKDLALKLDNKEINLRNLKNKTDEEIIAELTQVKGIGTWTAHMFLIFTLGRLNILPTGDLGIKRAIMLNYNLKKLPDEQKITKISKKYNWAPYNSIAAWYLWKSLEIN